VDQQVIDQASDRGEHAARARVNQVENILSAGPFRQDTLDNSILQGRSDHLFRQQGDANTAYRGL
jgi:hypothetical protein